MKWYNDHLKWDPSQYGDITYLPVHPHQVWIPDIILKNNADAEAVRIQGDTDTVWIKYTGKCSWYPKVTIQSSFKAKVVDFPFDNQLFFFHFGSWSFGEKRLRILMEKEKPIIDAHYLEDAEWDLIGMDKKVVRTGYDSDAYIEIIFSYSVSRKPAYCVITAIAPSIGLMSLILFSYILPPNNGERIKVILTALLAFTVFLVEMNRYLPRNSEEVPVLQVYYMATMAGCILMFIITCVFARLFGNDIKNKTPIYVPFWVKKYVLRIKEGGEIISPYQLFPTKECQEGNTLLWKQKSRMVVDDEEAEKVEQATIDMTWVELMNHVDRLCMKIFVLLFLCTTIIILLPPYYRKYYANNDKLNADTDHH